MYIHVQCWQVKPSWRSLPLKNQIDYFSQMKQVVQDLHVSGIRLLNCPFEQAHAAFLRERYLFVWKLPSQGLTSLLEETIQAVGWHGYFEEVVLRHEMIVPDPHFRAAPTGFS